MLSQRKSVKNFDCLECGKKFTQKGSVNKHMLTHTGVKNFECLECGKKFTQKGDLNTHILTHTGVKNFECLKCGKTFTQKGNLNTHMLTHTGVKNFECLECSKKFTRKGHLNTHMLTHTGYQDLKNDLKSTWALKEIEIIPVVVGATGVIKKNLKQYLQTIPSCPSIHEVQIAAIKGTVTILKRALGYKTSGV